jgi:hypothetical protein
MLIIQLLSRSTSGSCEERAADKRNIWGETEKDVKVTVEEQLKIYQNAITLLTSKVEELMGKRLQSLAVGCDSVKYGH